MNTFMNEDKGELSKLVVYVLSRSADRWFTDIRSISLEFVQIRWKSQLPETQVTITNSQFQLPENIPITS